MVKRGQVSTLAYLQGSMALIAEGRADNADDFAKPEQTLRELAVTKKLIPILEDYSGESLKGCVERFSKAVEDSGQVFEGNTLAHCGNPSLDAHTVPIFFRELVIGEVAFVIKAFPLNEDQANSLLRTLSGMSLLDSLELKLSEPVYPLALGKCVADGMGYLLIALSVAKGCRFDIYLSRLIKAMRSKKTPQKAFQRILKACVVVGSALGELHGKVSGKKRPLPDYLCEKYREVGMRGKLRKYYTELNHQGIADALDASCEKARGDSSTSCFHFGDINLGNFFYQEKEGFISFIDTDESHTSVNREGDPIGSPVLDFARFESKLDSSLVLGLKKEELKEMKEAFHKGYLSKAQQIPPASVRKFMQQSMDVRDLAVASEILENGKRRGRKFTQGVQELLLEKLSQH